MGRRIHVVAAVIEGAANQILITRRAHAAHQGGLWEFPGGKVEAGESEIDALSRELDEELGICVNSALPLIRIRHDYHDKSVLLSCWRVTGFRGRPEGREGQPMAWVSGDELSSYEFPAANRPIVQAACLPAFQLITPASPPGPEALSLATQKAAQQGSRMFQLRLPDASLSCIEEHYQAMLEALSPYTQARVYVNTRLESAEALKADYLHLSSHLARSLDPAALAGFKGLGMSCHSEQELRRAAELAVDYALLSPVKQTLSHPDAEAMGWQRFSELVEQAVVPVYALGGTQYADLAIARTHGAQGIAGIRGLWGEGLFRP